MDHASIVGSLLSVDAVRPCEGGSSSCRAGCGALRCDPGISEASAARADGSTPVARGGTATGATSALAGGKVAAGAASVCGRPAAPVAADERFCSPSCPTRCATWSALVSAARLRPRRIKAQCDLMWALNGLDQITLFRALYFKVRFTYT